MWWKTNKTLRQQIFDLESRNFDLQRETFEAKAFEQIAADKLKLWVNKHDDLLVRYKLLEKTKVAYGKEETDQQPEAEAQSQA